MSMENHPFQLSSSYDDSPRNFLPAGLFLEGLNGASNGQYMAVGRMDYPMPLSPMNGPRTSGTPFQFSRTENIQYLAQMISPRSPQPQYQALNRRQFKGPPAKAWDARAFLEEDPESIHHTQSKLEARAVSFAPAIQLMTHHNPPSLYPDNIENFEPGSPAWRPSSKDQPLPGSSSSSWSTLLNAQHYQRAYPNTPNFKQWLKDEKMTPKKKAGVDKLGPERYKSLRVSGKSSKSAHDSQGRGERLGTFYDPGFNNMDKGSFRTSSNKPVQRHPAVSQRQMPRHQEKKQSLYKTELCTNWTLTANCTYGNKCHFAHGIDDLNCRTRLENFKTQPCCDPAREGSRRCLYGSRCNYCHPGEAIRRPIGNTYYDRDYYKDLEKDFGENKYPFGIYV